MENRRITLTIGGDEMEQIPGWMNPDVPKTPWDNMTKMQIYKEIGICDKKIQEHQEALEIWISKKNEILWLLLRRYPH